MMTLTLTARRTMSIRSQSDIVESFMASTTNNFTNISKVARRRYRTIIPSTARKLKRFEDISGSPNGVQNTQSPQDLPSKSPRSNATQVHVLCLEDYEKAVMAFMREPLVSLAKPERSARRPLKCVCSNKADAQGPESNPILDRLRDDYKNADVSDIQNQRVPSLDPERDEFLDRTQTVSDTSSERITSDACDRDKDKNLQFKLSFMFRKELADWDSTLKQPSSNLSTY